MKNKNTRTLAINSDLRVPKILLLFLSTIFLLSLMNKNNASMVNRKPQSIKHADQITNDTAIYQNLREIKITQLRNIDFDNDIATLSAQEKHYRRPVPLRISVPMNRIMNTPYRSAKNSPSQTAVQFKTSRFR